MQESLHLAAGENAQKRRGPKVTAQSQKFQLKTLPNDQALLYSIYGRRCKFKKAGVRFAGEIG